MVDPNRQEQAFRALHCVLIEARLMALEGATSDELAGVLDWAELLPVFLNGGQDKTDDFRNVLDVLTRQNPRFRPAKLAFAGPRRVPRRIPS